MREEKEREKARKEKDKGGKERGGKGWNERGLTAASRWRAIKVIIRISAVTAITAASIGVIIWIATVRVARITSARRSIHARVSNCFRTPQSLTTERKTCTTQEGNQKQ